MFAIFYEGGHMLPKEILTLLGLDSSVFNIDEYLIENENELLIYSSLKEKTRKCPNCNSLNCVINGNDTICLKYNILPYIEKPLKLLIKKKRYLCLDCKKTYTEKTPIAQDKHTIPTGIFMIIYERTKEIRSFSSIAKELKVSITQVIRIFDKVVKVGRSALSTSICIDEKHFKNNLGSYACIISNPVNGKILDVLPTRTKDYLFYYFSKISIIERNTVKYFISDMFLGYKYIKNKFFPNAIHIIDKFHIKKLFTECIQQLRREAYKKYPKDSIEYRFLKKEWKLFLMDPGNKIVLEKSYIDENGELIDLKEKMKRILRNHPPIVEIYSIYYDFSKYIVTGKSDEDLKSDLEFIIQRLINSLNPKIQIIGNTMIEYFDEILNAYSSANKYNLTNAVAESNNNRIQKIIDVSYGMRDFNRFRKRILHIDANKKR